MRLIGTGLPEDAWFCPVTVASTANIVLAGAQTVDGVAVGQYAVGDPRVQRVLVKNNTDTRANGIYDANSGQWKRSLDAADSSQWATGVQVRVSSGTANAGSIWAVSTASTTIVLGTDAIAFTQVHDVTAIQSLTFTAPAEFAVAGSPTSGAAPTIALSKVNQSPNTVYAGPASGGAAAPVFRALVSADITGVSREKLTADRTYYVRTDGSDSNNGLSNTPGGAFLTPQHALDIVAQTIDFGGAHFVDIVLVGTFSAGDVMLRVNGPWVGAQPSTTTFPGSRTVPVLVRGSTSNAADTTIDATTFTVLVVNCGQLAIQDMTVTSSAGYATLTAGEAQLQFGNIIFGACGGAKIGSFHASIVENYSNFTVQGNCAQVIEANFQSAIYLSVATMTIGNSFTCTEFAKADKCSDLSIAGLSIATGGNTVTGKRFTVDGGASINPRGLSKTFFPGTLPGTAIGGGVYGGEATAFDINANTAALVASITGSRNFCLQGADGSNLFAEMHAFGGLPGILTARYGGTAAAPTAVGSGLQLNTVGATYGYDGAATGVAFGINVYTTQVWTGSAHGSRAEAVLVPNGSTTGVAYQGWEQDGGITFPPSVTGGSKGLGTVNVSGGFYVGGNALALGNLAPIAGLSVVCVTGAASGVPAALTASVANSVFRMNAAGTVISWGPINLASANAVTGVLAAVNGGTGSVTSGKALARSSASAGAVEEIDIPLPSPQMRGTLTSGTAVTTSDVTAAGTIYLSPFGGQLVPIYNGKNMVGKTTGGQLSLALDSNSGHTGYHQSGKNFDAFVALNGGAATLGTGPAWSTDTTRGTGAGTTELEFFQGLWVNKNTITLRIGTLVGDTISVSARQATAMFSFRCTADGQTEDSAAKRFVSNMYRQTRAPRQMKATDSTDSWNYSTASYRQANGAAANQLDLLNAQSEDNVTVFAQSLALNSTATARSVYTGIGVDSTTVSSSTIQWGGSCTNTVAQFPQAQYNGYPGLGRHFLAWLEKGAGSDTQTWFGDAGIPPDDTAGIMGTVWA